MNLKDLSIKNCYEVKFSHGGHLFAVVNNVMVQLFNFYTLDQPPHYQFKAQAGYGLAYIENSKQWLGSKMI